MIPSFSSFPYKQEAKTEKYFADSLTPVSCKRGLIICNVLQLSVKYLIYLYFLLCFCNRNRGKVFLLTCCQSAKDSS